MKKQATLQARPLTISLALLLLLFTGGCGADKMGMITDYSLRTNWMLLPTKGHDGRGCLLSVSHRLGQRE